MFAPKIPQTATKEAGTPSRTQANQSSHPLEKRFGRSPADQIVLLQRSIGNQSVLRLLARHGANNTPNPVRPSPLWDFSKIPIFPPGHPDRPQQGFPILAQPAKPISAQGATRAQARSPQSRVYEQHHSGLAYDFSSISVLPPSPLFIQRKLAINAPGDAYEREADRVADQVMRMPQPQAATGPVTSSAPAVQRECACGGSCEDCKRKNKHEEPAKVQMKASGPGSAGGMEAPPIVHEVLRSPGQPLDAAARSFMEPRFAWDFSSVRVHTDRKAAESARAVWARAYTVGQDVVFGAGEYAPGTNAGQRLLGHELAHVLQQSKGLFGQQLQRDMIPFGKLTWSNFNGTPPPIDPKNPQASDQWGAETNSFIDQIPSYSPKTSAEPVKPAKKCGKGDTMFQATAVPDDDSYKGIVAKMDTDKSWARPLNRTGDATDYCNQKVAICENWFQQNKGGLRFSPTFPVDPIDITKREDCRKLIVPRCTKVWAPQERERLLKHEQYHFTLTNVIANNMKQDLDARAKAFSATASACGNDASREAARNDYLVKVQAALGDPAQAWLNARSKAQGEYDTDTNHGGDFAAQKTWETKIDGGLKGYGPAPVAKATTTSPSSPAPTTTPPPATPTPKK